MTEYSSSLFRGCFRRDVSHYCLPLRKQVWEVQKFYSEIKGGLQGCSDGKLEHGELETKLEAGHFMLLVRRDPLTFSNWF